MSIISSTILKQRIYETADNRLRLFVVPILDVNGQIDTGRGALDIRLGTDFIITKRAQLTHVDPYATEPEKTAADFKKYQERITIGFGSRFVLHPRQYAIGSTLEYFRFPVDLAGLVVGRSSWGRLGLVIAMATLVHPGFTGVITLELQNLGDVPITLYAGSRIGQMVFYEVRGNELVSFDEIYKGTKYTAAVTAGFSRLYDDSEREKIIEFGKLYSEASNVFI
jgi:dCTP deaminase